MACPLIMEYKGKSFLAIQAPEMLLGFRIVCRNYRLPATKRQVYLLATQRRLNLRSFISQISEISFTVIYIELSTTLFNIEFLLNFLKIRFNLPTGKGSFIAVAVGVAVLSGKTVHFKNPAFPFFKGYSQSVTHAHTYGLTVDNS